MLQGAGRLGQGVTAGSLSLPSCSAEACGTSDAVQAATHPTPRPGTARGFSTWPQAAPRPRGAEPRLQAATHKGTTDGWAARQPGARAEGRYFEGP